MACLYARSVRGEDGILIAAERATVEAETPAVSREGQSLRLRHWVAVGVGNVEVIDRHVALVQAEGARPARDGTCERSALDFHARGSLLVVVTRFVLAQTVSESDLILLVRLGAE